MKHLLSTHDLSTSDVISLLKTADHMTEISSRPQPKVPALRGNTVANVFFEDSTRTRLSFETAAKRLSADTMTFSASSSSVNKGESLRDTIETLTAMGVDAFVVRHKSSGVPQQITQWTSAAVINAGDGWHQHPTQALLDTYTITRSFESPESLAGRTIAIVGDIKHSRVARSNIDLFTRLGAHVIVVAPDTLLPNDISSWGVDTCAGIDEVLEDIDVLYMLRMQRERMDSALIPDLAEYVSRFSLTQDRANRLQVHALLMHPGPMNRGVEMLVDPADVPGSRILQQVTNGIAIRMAVLFTILGSGAAATLGQGVES
jgi:aspartate carbamoyltransferase catalytic subunit